MRFVIFSTIVCSLWFATHTNAYASLSKKFAPKEKALREAIIEVAKEHDSTKKLLLNSIFTVQLNAALRMDSAILFPFDSVPYLYQLTSNNGLVRIITWNVPAGSQQHYFGFILVRNKKSETTVHIVPLTDKRPATKEVESKTLPPSEWFGALYTEIIEHKLPYTNATAYTLLGISLNNRLTSKKVIDVLQIADEGKLSFGFPIFRQKKKLTNRIIFEYKAEAVMPLQYNAKMKLITFPLLTPMYRQLRGRYEHYVPSDSYDGLKHKDGYWIYTENVPLSSTVEIKRRVKAPKKQTRR
ncbi:MAG: hypothetical protein ACRCZB_06410 [Bacteroidales bacterium]